MNIFVTVVVPAYNAAKYLSETIESVLAQTFKDFELLVIDDGSTDNTAEIAHQYSQQDSRVKLFYQENQGVSVARNMGIQMAQGEFVAFLDSDDQWLSDKLAVHIEHLTSQPELGISFAKVEFMTPDSNPTGQFSNSSLTNLTSVQLYYENLIITPSNVVIRRAVFKQVGNFDPNLKGTEDAELFLRISCNGWKVEGIDRVLTRYRTSIGGVSSQLSRMEEDWNRFNKKVQSYAPDIINEHYSQAKAFFLRYLARRALRCNLPSQVGVNFMNRSLQSDWKLILREPRRTLLTMLAIYGQYLLSGFTNHNPLNQNLEK
jgi:glycosyltransferase involved in cell wall biosynthesis